MPKTRFLPDLITCCGRIWRAIESLGAVYDRAYLCLIGRVKVGAGSPRFLIQSDRFYKPAQADLRGRSTLKNRVFSRLKKRHKLSKKPGFCLIQNSLSESGRFMEFIMLNPVNLPEKLMASRSRRSFECLIQHFGKRRVSVYSKC